MFINIDDNITIGVQSKTGLLRHSTISILTKLLLDCPCRGAEIGVYKGETTEYLAQCSHIKKLYAIDPWTQDNLEYEDYKKLSKQFGRSNSHGKSLDVETWDELYDYVKRRLSGYKSVELMRDTSANAFDEIDHDLDFVFIDGDHAYESIKFDIYTWSQKVKSRGLLMGHDYCKSSVKRAVDEYFEERGSIYRDVVDSEKNSLVNAEDNTIWWRQKT